MKKPFILSLAVLSFSAFSFVGLSSCSGDDGDDEKYDSEKDQPTFGIPSDHLPKDQNFFYGFWQTSEGPMSFILYPNGTCKGLNNLTSNATGSGEWTYNPTSNILSTTINSCQYQVTLCNNKGTAWTGVQLGSNLAQTFQMSNPTLTILSNSMWTDGNYTMTIGETVKINMEKVSGDIKVDVTMEYDNNKTPNEGTPYQYVKRIITITYYVRNGVTENGLAGTFKSKSYVNANGSYRWITDGSGYILIEDYLTPDPTLHFNSMQYHLSHKK